MSRQSRKWTQLKSLSQSIFHTNGSMEGARICAKFNHDPILWNKFWNVQKGESPEKSKSMSPSLTWCISVASITQQDRKDVDSVCMYVCADCTSPFFFLFYFQQEGYMTEQNLKSTTLTRLCVWCCFLNKVQNEQAVWGLAEVQSYCLLISRQPMGLCFLFSISSTVQKCALSLVFILGSLT